MDILKFALLHGNAHPPVRKHRSDAGADVFADCSEHISPHSCAIISTGVTFHIPEGYMLSVRPKGRNDHLIGAGVVDAGYQGEILVKVVNYTDKPMTIYRGDAVAQVVLVPIVTPALEEVPKEEIHSTLTERAGTGGIVAQLNN